MSKLNFGCGYDIRPGWVNVDKVRHGNHEVADILSKWPYEPNTFDEIEANHVLHMFTYQELPLVLKRLLSNLKPGGVFRISEFDPIKAFEAYQRGDADALVIPDSVEPTIDGKFNAYLTWYSTRRSIHTAKGLCERLMDAGFKNATWYEGNLGDPRRNESFYVMGVK